MYYIAAPFGNYLFTRKTRSVLGTYTLKQRDGLLKQIVKSLRYKNGAWYNSLGLRNPGIDFGIRRYNQKRGDILSIAAIEEGDWELLNQRIPEYCHLELNLSCPNIEHFDNYYQGIECFLNNKRKVIAKLAPLTPSATVQELVNLGFNSFHCCNTLPTKDGGMSGKGLEKYVDRLIKIVKHFKEDAEIIAGGGIKSIEDVERYREMGANSFSLGTVCFNIGTFYLIIHEIGKKKK